MHLNSDDSTRLSKLPLCRTPWRRGVRWLPLVALITGLLSLGQAVAQEAQETAVVPSSMPTSSGRSAKVCRHEDVTGSRMRKRVCHTPEQWEARERAAKAAVRELDDKPVAGHLNEE